ncbi:4,5-DOPA dioxygenase extradiol [bacterium]|nr:4,5-DOPA dioxygenase extradiol [bacterium]
MSHSPQPALFIGHGNPMHAVSDNAFTAMLSRLGESFEKPKALVCVSAHWLTQGTFVTSNEHPKTIHDFGGFPQELFNVQYPAPGAPELAQQICDAIREPSIKLNDEWGLDHGCWAVLKHLYPKADVPVVQLSISIAESPAFHFELGKQLSFLRDEGVMIIGSGNVVHNLSRIQWHGEAKPYSWAQHFETWVKERLVAHEHQALVHDALKSEEGKLSAPTPDHWYPLLYVLGASRQSDKLQCEYEGIEMGSISMLSFSYS